MARGPGRHESQRIRTATVERSLVAGRSGTRLDQRRATSRSSGARTQSNARPVPRMPKTRPETQVRSKGITLAGTLLILGLTVLAFAGGRLFGRVEEPAAETQRGNDSADSSGSRARSGRAAS